nr:hypothetical protein [Tanacetum cinerariifolium]
MVAPFISISSEESVGSRAPRVILFGAIPAIIPIIPEVPIVLVDPLVAPEVGTILVVSLTGVLDLVDYSSSFDSDPSEDSLPPVADLPLVSPSGSSSHDTLAPSSEFPLAPIVASSGIRRRPATIIQPGEAIPFGRLYRTHSNEQRKLAPTPADLLPPRKRFRDSYSPEHSKEEQWSTPLSTLYPLTTSESSLGSSFERSLDSSSLFSRPSRKRCRFPTTSAPSPTHDSRLIAPTPADLLPPRKRFRDSYSPEHSKEEQSNRNPFLSILQDSFPGFDSIFHIPPRWDTTRVVNALQEPFVVNQDPGKNSSQSPPQINNHCCYGCGDPLEDIICHQCTCELCGKGARYGYNCPSKVLIIPNLEPFNNQTVDKLPQTVPSFDSTCYSEDGNSFTCDSPSNLFHYSLNVFDPLSQPPLYLCEFCGNDARYGHYCTPQKKKEKQIEEEQTAKAQYWKILVCYDDDDDDEDYTIAITNKEPDNSLSMRDEHLDTIPVTKSNEFIKSSVENLVPNDDDDDDEDYTIAITYKEPDNSLSMGDEHLDTIPVTKSNEFIKSSVENLVPNPSESEGEHECDVPACEDFTTFSNIIFDSDYDFSSRDDQSFYNEDIPKEIYLNPLFDEEIISIKIDPHHFNAESDLIESLLNRDSLIISSSSKIDSLFDEFAGELTLLKSILPRINKTDCDPEEEIRFIKRFDSFMEEINLSSTLDDPMPSGIEKDDYDSERDILILEELLSNDSLSIPKNESFHFDIPSSSRPPAKPPDGNSGILNVKVMGGISEHKVPMPRIMFTQPTLVPNQEKSHNLLSHLGHEAFQPSTKYPMMI